MFTHSMQKHTQTWVYIVTIYWLIQSVVLTTIKEGGVFPIFVGGMTLVMSIFLMFYCNKIATYIYLFLLFVLTTYIVIFMIFWDLFSPFEPIKLLLLVWGAADLLFIYLTWLCFMIRLKV